MPLPLWLLVPAPSSLPLGLSLSDKEAWGCPAQELLWSTFLWPSSMGTREAGTATSASSLAGELGGNVRGWVAVLSPEEPAVLSSGFTLIGNDIKLNSPSSLIGQALTEILQHPDRARDALRVLLHLVRANGAPLGNLGKVPARTSWDSMWWGG